MTTPCPSTTDLRGLVNGSLSDSEADSLQLHLERCETCQKALQEIVADGDFWQSASQNLSDDEAVGPGLEQVVEELQQQSPEDAEEMGEAIELKLSFIDPPTEPGTIGRLKHYDILRVAGRGGMGIVVKAFDRTLRRVVAIKLLAPHLAGNGQARQRFIREGRAAAGICHEHVVTIHSVEESPPFIVMQYVKGETLEARIHRNGSLDVREAVRIAKQIAQGLAAAHTQGVVHRDIKPANILLENGIARVRITDFGLARAVDDASLTQSGVVAGTPQYMAPEQANGDAVDERADLFSLGSVIYTMLAGHAPFRATTTMGVLKRLCDHSARPIREINPDVPDWLVLLINRLHAKRPADRFQSADEVADLLERGLASLQTGNATTMTVPTVESSVSPAVSPAIRDQAVAALHSDSAGQALPRWMMLQIPAWAIAAPLILFLGLIANGPRLNGLHPETMFVAAGLGLAGFIGFAWANGVASIARLQQSGADETASGTTFDRLSRRVADVMPRKWYRVLGWLAAWLFPVLVWTRAFFREESWALSESLDSLPNRDRHMLTFAAAVFCLWWLVAILWFRRKRPDGSRLFPERRPRRVLATLILAVMFCICGLWTWFSDVHYLAEQRRTRIELSDVASVVVPNSPNAGHHLKLDFEKPLKGTAVVIELPDNEHYRFTSEHGGVVSNGFGSRSGTFPWKAYVGHTEFATGEVTLVPNQVAEINVPQPKLRQLITGRWRTAQKVASAEFGMPGGMSGMSGTGDDAPQMEFEFDAHRLLLVTHGQGVAMNGGQAERLDRSDFSIEIDDSVNPALINLQEQNETRIAGILRFVPGSNPQGTSMYGREGMGMPPEYAGGGMEGGGYGGGSMYGGDMGAAVGQTPDVLEICINDGGGLRPWEFKTNGQTGQTLLRMQRVKSSQTLREEMAFQPVETASEPEIVKEAIIAWSRKLKVEPEGMNSLGMELVLVPPTEFKQIKPILPHVRLPRTNTDSNGDDEPTPVEMSAYADMRGNPILNTRPASFAVTYPFVMSRSPVSNEQFQNFVEATGYLTDAERGAMLPKPPSAQSGLNPNSVPGYPGGAGPPESKKATSIDDAQQPTGPGGWRRNGDKFVFEKDRKWRTDGADAEPSDPVHPVVFISWRDANEFCKWLSEKESRQYRLPTSHEWAAAMQLGVKQLPPVPGETNPGANRNFDARANHMLNLQTSELLFAEWTSDHSQPDFVLLIRKTLSPDGSRFGWSPKYSAGQTFRAEGIGFRVVAEQQALAGRKSEEESSDSPSAGTTE
ncbi:MAG: protein kinase [Rhodopirellula sp.]|nr:protein kinase [Rhodopirellula sp.]